MARPHTTLVNDPLSVESLVAGLEAEAREPGEGCGAVCSFVGVVRATHKGRRVRYLEYEAYEPLARRALALIEQEVAAGWPAGRVAIQHRLGRLTVGEASVAIAAASAHRAEAFQICRYAIERVKQIVPIWKHEFFEDGEDWVEGSIADPDDVVAREQARARACA